MHNLAMKRICFYVTDAELDTFCALLDAAKCTNPHLTGSEMVRSWIRERATKDTPKPQVVASVTPTDPTDTPKSTGLIARLSEMQKSKPAQYWNPAWGPNPNGPTPAEK